MSLYRVFVSPPVYVPPCIKLLNMQKDEHSQSSNYPHGSASLVQQLLHSFQDFLVQLNHLELKEVA